jgi:hypothetical protein
MKPGDLRRFKDGPYGLVNLGFEGSTFMVLRVDRVTVRSGGSVDILLDGKREEGLGYFWVEDSSEVVDAAG